MKLTKFGHSCVLVEIETDGQVHSALFDPGGWSDVPVDALPPLDAIFISHGHPDHCDIDLLTRLAAASPYASVTAPAVVVAQLHDAGITQATTDVPSGAVLFDAPHEGKPPFLDPPEEIGIHYLDTYTHPGDSHSFSETKAVLGLPVQAPWGSTMDAVLLALQLKPRYILPLHDWHWSDKARLSAYDRYEAFFKPYDITFLKPVNGDTIEITP